MKAVKIPITILFLLLLLGLLILFFKKDTLLTKNNEVVPPTSQQINIDTLRSSNTKKTVWQDENLGLKITAPEWIETRIPTSKDSSGEWQYSEWTKIYPKSEKSTFTYAGQIYEGVYITGLNYTEAPRVVFLDSTFTNNDLNYVVNTLLPSANFCATGWSKTDCTNQGNTHCYTKQQVIDNLTVKEQQNVGNYEAKLYSLDEQFSQSNDCSSQDTWVTKVKDGKFILSTVGPNDSLIRFESL